MGFRRTIDKNGGLSRLGRRLAEGAWHVHGTLTCKRMTGARKNSAILSKRSQAAEGLE